MTRNSTRSEVASDRSSGGRLQIGLDLGGTKIMAGLFDDSLAVVARDPAAAVDVPAWCRMKAQDYVGADVAEDGAPRYVVRRRAR